MSSKGEIGNRSRVRNIRWGVHFGSQIIEIDILILSCKPFSFSGPEINSPATFSPSSPSCSSSSLILSIFQRELLIKNFPSPSPQFFSDLRKDLESGIGSIHKNWILQPFALVNRFSKSSSFTLLTRLICGVQWVCLLHLWFFILPRWIFLLYFLW